MLYHLQIIKNTGASMKWIHAVLLLVYIRSWDHHTTSPSSLLHYQLQWFIVFIGVSTPSFLPSPPPLNLQTVQARLLRQAPILIFFVNPSPRNQIFQWTLVWILSCDRKIFLFINFVIPLKIEALSSSSLFENLIRDSILHP